MHELTSAAVALMVCVAAGSYLAGCCNGAIITSFLFYHCLLYTSPSPRDA